MITGCVTNLSILHLGGAAKFMKEQMDSDYLPVWMKELGYSTYFTG